jgi:hypothetical protein
VGTLVPVTVDVWGVGQGQSISLVSDVALGITDPPAISSFSRAIPQLGIVAVFATLTTVNEGMICIDLATVNTG